MTHSDNSRENYRKTSKIPVSMKNAGKKVKMNSVRILEIKKFLMLILWGLKKYTVRTIFSKYQLSEK
jgi:hypothetical protein